MAAYPIAIVQEAPAFLDKRECLSRAVSLINSCGRQGARLVVFPETWLPGYPVWVGEAASWGDKRAANAFAVLYENALEIPSADLSLLLKAAQRNKVYVSIGVNERESSYSRGTLYNSQLLISSAGELTVTHRKLMPTHAERTIWGRGDASGLKVVESEIGRVGSLICWEHWMPLSRFAMHAQGEQVHIAAWPGLTDTDLAEVASRHYAFEGRCHVVSAATYMTLEDIPEHFELRGSIRTKSRSDRDDVVMPGGSGIVGPDGTWVVGPVYDRSEVVWGEIDLDHVRYGFQTFDAAGHYNRPDIFRLEIDWGKQVPYHSKQDPSKYLPTRP